MRLALRLSQVAGVLTGQGPAGRLRRHSQPLPVTRFPLPLPTGSRMTPEKFLSRLPKLVIRQGEVIDIRGPIRDALQVRPA